MPAFDAAESVEPNGVLYPRANRDMFPLPGTQPAPSDVYLNQATEFPPSSLQPAFPDVAGPPEGYFEQPTFANPPNPVVDRGLIEK